MLNKKTHNDFSQEIKNSVDTALSKEVEMHFQVKDLGK